MSVRVLAGFSAGVAWLLCAAASQAACSTDNECPGEQVCESGACVAPPPAALPSPPVVAPPAPVTPKAPVTRSIAAEPTAAMPVEGAPRPESRGMRHSTGMMVGGLIITGLAVIPLNIALLGSLSCGESTCDTSSYVTGGWIAAGVLLAIGIPLTVIGGKREPAPSARLTPWATPRSVGLGLRLEL